MAENEQEMAVKIDEVITKLELIVNKKGKETDRQSWPREKKPLKRILLGINKLISDRYSFKEGLGFGGTAYIIKVEDTNLRYPFVLKVPRQTDEGRDSFAKIIDNEIESLHAARHPNVVEIVYANSITQNNRKIPFFVEDYIPDPKNALEYFQENIIKERDLLNNIKQIIIGIRHLHENGIIHCDIKPENILIAKKGQAVISDLGSARRLVVDDKQKNEEIDIYFDNKYAHPDIRLSTAQVKASVDSRAVKRQIKRGNLTSQLDLYALGKSILELLDILEPERCVDLQSYTRKYLQLMACRLLDGRNEEAEIAIGLPREAFKDDEIKYNSINQVETDIYKITGDYSIHQRIPEIDMYSVDNIQISCLSPTSLTERLKAIINHATMKRLSNVSQMGFIKMIYPTATHTRIEHSLGSFTNTARYCDALYNDPVNPFFRQIMNESDIKSVLLAALLFDIGHYSLGHDMGEAEPGLFDYKEHTFNILKGQYYSLDSYGLKRIVEDEDKWNVDLQRVTKIITTKTTNYNDSIKDRILHSLIDSPIDADKLDYLVRDSENLGVQFGWAIDFPRLLQSLTIVYRPKLTKIYVSLGIHERGRFQAEAVTFVRYKMFGTVYWQNTARATKAMFHRAIWETLYENELNKGKLELVKKDFFDFIFYRKPFYKETPKLENSPTHLSLSDFYTLQWFGETTTRPGLELLRKIRDRHLFKTFHNINIKNDKDLWELLTNVRAKTDGENNGRRTGEVILLIQKKVQERMTNYLETKYLADPQEETPVDRRMIESVLERSKNGDILILVDIPRFRYGRNTQLDYLQETELHDMTGEWKESGDPEDSETIKGFNDLFMSFVASIRVLCDPDCRDVFDLLNENEIAELLRESTADIDIN